MAHNVIAHRVGFGIGTGVAAIASLPLSALAVEAVSERAENFILPTQLGVSTAAGAGLAALLPGVAGAQAGRGRAALVGGAIGLAAGAAADVGWFALIAG